jgi:hypothetical protein
MSAAMASRRIIYTVIAIAVAVAIPILAKPVAWLWWMASEEMFPARISWDGKTAWKRCESAIAGKTTWPDGAEAACAAMHLCANEAVLSEEQIDRLTQIMRDTPGCRPP